MIYSVVLVSSWLPCRTVSTAASATLPTFSTSPNKWTSRDSPFLVPVIRVG